MRKLFACKAQINEHHASMKAKRVAMEDKKVQKVYTGHSNMQMDTVTKLRETVAKG